MSSPAAASTPHAPETARHDAIVIAAGVSGLFQLYGRRLSAHVLEGAERWLPSQVDAWFTGVDFNLPGRQRRRLRLYANGLPTYRRGCDEAAAAGYAGLVIE